MADKEKLQDKSKSSLFRSKSDGKRESKRQRKRNKRLRASNGESAENVCDINVERAETLEGNVSQACTSKVNNDPNDKATDELKREEQSRSATNEMKVPANTEADLETSPCDEQKTAGNASEKELGANDKPNEDAKTSEIIESMEHSDNSELAAVEQNKISCEREEVEDASEMRQTLADVDNKACEVTAAGDSKKHRKASSPLASFRRNRKKYKEQKNQQGTGNAEKSGDSLNESKKTAHSEPQEVEQIATRTTTESEATNSKGEDKQEIPEALTTKTTELQESKIEKVEKLVASGSKMANENIEEQVSATKVHKEKTSGLFASFRRNKKKADSTREENTGGKQEENRPESANAPPESGKENVADNAPEREERSISANDKEITEQQQQQEASGSDEQATKQDNELESFPAQEDQDIVEKTAVDERMLHEEKDKENKPKKGKRFVPFSNFSRSKKQAIKLTQHETHRDADVEHMASTSTQVQSDVKSKIEDSLPGQENREEHDSLKRSQTEEVPSAENPKELPSGSEIAPSGSEIAPNGSDIAPSGTAQSEQVPELSTGNEANSPQEQKEQQDGNDTTPEKKKSGFRKRISKMKLHGGKSKENATTEYGKKQPEVDLKGKNSEAGTSGNETSKQVKRKKSGGLHKKLSQALKRNKPGHLELNESYDDPSVNEEECQPLLKSKCSVSPTAAKTKETISTVEEPRDLKGNEEKQNQEITEENEKELECEQSLNASSSSVDIVVKRVTFSLDEQTTEMTDSDINEEQPLNCVTEDKERAAEKHTDPEIDPETPHEQPLNGVTEDGEQPEEKRTVPETLQEMPYDEDSTKHKEDGVTRDQEESVTRVEEESVAYVDEDGVTRDQEESMTRFAEESVTHGDKDGVTRDREESATRDKEEGLAHDDEDSVTRDQEESATRGEEESVIHDDEDKMVGAYSICRNIMEQVMAELLGFVATKEATQPDISNDGVPTEETTANEENDNVGITSIPESAASSMESLLSTGTVVYLESSESELETVSPIPDMCMCENVDTENESEQQVIQGEKASELEDQPETRNASSRAQVEDKDDDQLTLQGSEELTELNKSQVDETSPVSEDVPPEAWLVETPEKSTLESEVADDAEEESTNSEGNTTTADVPKEKGVADRTIETSIEQNIERSIEDSLRRSLQTSQHLLSHSLKEDWILVRPRLDISQEMSYQVKAFALDSYAHGPNCCSLM